jgi:hypothetical protein
MADRLDELLKRLPTAILDHRLDQLEPQVWSRIAAQREPGLFAAGAFRLQLIAAGMALAIGLVLGWSMNNRPQTAYGQSLYASYAAVGPMGRLENGL